MTPKNPLIRIRKRSLLLCLAAVSISALARAQDAAVPVTLVAPANVLTTVAYDVSAQSVAQNISTLSAEITATVRAIDADVGATVSAGQRLVRLDRKDAGLTLDRATAELQRASSERELAASRLQRGRELADQQFMSVDELADLSTQVAMLDAQIAVARVSVAQAEEGLGDTIISAPFDGVVTARDAQLGSLVIPGQALVTLTQTSGTEVAASVSTAQLAALQQADDIRFSVPGATGTSLMLARAGEVLDPNTRLHSVRLVATDSTKLLPGLAGRLRFRSRQTFLPAAYLQRRDTGLGVFVVTPQTPDAAHFMIIERAQEGRPASVALPAGTRIIDGGREKLNDGDAIAVADG